MKLPFLRREEQPAEAGWEADVRRRLEWEVKASEQQAANARRVAALYPRASDQAEVLLTDADKHETTTVLAQWHLDNVGVPWAEWSPAPVHDPSDGWVR